MIKEDAVNGNMTPSLKIEREWLGNCFSDFLDRMPKEHLLNQLYMFSENYNVDDAVKNILSLDHCFFTEEFDLGINELNKKLDLTLKPLHVRKTGMDIKISESEKSRLTDMVSVETDLLNRVKSKIHLNLR